MFTTTRWTWSNGRSTIGLFSFKIFLKLISFFQGTEREIIESQKLCRRIDEITPALVQAGRIVLNEPNNKVK